ncbi:MAG: hypothetical protein IT461_08530 [Planctomycetes bacterium]|nr:hypothetical protein [Planctomycetota bacterium]
MLTLLCSLTACAFTGSEALTTSDMENALAEEPRTFSALLRTLRGYTTDNLERLKESFIARNPAEIEQWRSETDDKYFRKIRWKSNSDSQAAYAIRQIVGVLPDIQTFSPSDTSWAIVVDERDIILGWIRP